MLRPAGFSLLKRPLAYTFYILLYAQHKQPRKVQSEIIQTRRQKYLVDHSRLEYGVK